MKIVSQNVMCWEHTDGALFADRRPLIREAVAGADIIGFQEVTPYWRECFEADLPGYENILVYRGKESWEATPIYWNTARLEKKQDGHFWLSETPERESYGWGARCLRDCCWVRLCDKQTQRELIAVNTHLDHISEEARIKGIELICWFIRENFGADMPLVLIGDFNARPGTPTVQTADALLTDVRTAVGLEQFEPTFHGFQKEKECCIDYIYISSNLTCSAFEMVKKTSGNTIQSDHYGLSAEVQWR